MDHVLQNGEVCIFLLRKLSALVKLPSSTLQASFWTHHLIVGNFIHLIDSLSDGKLPNISRENTFKMG
jgi:hypothetical protein